MSWLKTYFHQIQLGVFFVFSFAIFFVFKGLSDYVEQRDSGEYLVSLRENSTTGCLSFYERQNNILVIGDSHSYAGFDFYKLSQLTGTSKISTCTMGGLYFDSLVELIERIPKLEAVPANIIFGLSLRQFTTGSDRGNQLKEHSKLIEAMGSSPQNVFLKIKTNLNSLIFQSPVAKSLVEGRQSDLKYWQSTFDKIDLRKVDFVFDRIHHPAKDNWQKYMQQLSFLKENKKNIDRFCDVIRKNNINLFLVDLPESPYLQGMYKLSDLNQYQEVMRSLSACAKKIVRMSNKEWGIDGRSFLNRSLSQNWNFEELYADLDKTPTERKNLAFDLDHPNLVGAQVITEKLYNEIKSDLKYAF